VETRVVERILGAHPPLAQELTTILIKTKFLIEKID